MGDKLTPSLAPEAEQLKVAALESAALVAVVRSPQEKAPAIYAQMKLASILKAVEKARKEVKEPYLEACRLIDGTAKKFCLDLEWEQIRLGKIVGDYDMEQLAIARRAEAARQEELRRIAEQEAAEKRRIEAEARAAEEARQAEARKQEEARQAEERRIAAERAQAKNAAERKRLDSERAALIEKQKVQEAEFAKQRESERINRQAQLKRLQELLAQAAEAVGPEKGMAKSAGQVVKPVWKFEVVNIGLLYKMHPGLVTLTVNTAEINQCLAQGVRDIKGLRIWEEVKSTVRTSGQQAINV